MILHSKWTLLNSCCFFSNAHDHWKKEIFVSSRLQEQYENVRWEFLFSLWAWNSKKKLVFLFILAVVPCKIQLMLYLSLKSIYSYGYCPFPKRPNLLKIDSGGTFAKLKSTLAYLLSRIGPFIHEIANDLTWYHFHWIEWCTHIRLWLIFWSAIGHIEKVIVSLKIESWNINNVFPFKIRPVN